MSMENTPKEKLEYFSSNSETRLRGSETLEVIIPDRYPDAREILLVTGHACAKAKEQNGHPLLQATMEVFALVESVEDSLYTLSCEIPIAIHSNLTEEEESCLFYVIREAGSDAVIVNSRKISFSGEIGVTATLYHKRELDYVSSLGEDAIAIPCEASICPRGLAVTEVFSVSDELPFPDEKGDIAGIFRKDVTLEILEKKLIHEKLIVRANAKLSLSFLTSDGKPESVTWDLPFTHVFELTGMGEEETPKVTFRTEKLSLVPQSKEGEWVLSTFLELRAEILCYSNVTMRTVEDGYSLKTRMILKRETVSFPKALIEESEACDVVCNVELPGDVTGLEDVFASVSTPITYLLEDERLRIVTNLTVVAIGCSDHGYRIIKKITPVECYMNATTPATNVICSLGKLHTGGVGGGACEITTQVTFRIYGEDMLECSVVSDVIQEERDLAGLPSFVLTEAMEGERAYDLGKRYNARPDAILEANHLEPGVPMPSGKRILIPVYKPVNK